MSLRHTGGIRAEMDKLLVANNYAQAITYVPSFNDARKIVDASIQELVDASQTSAQAGVTKTEKDFSSARIIMIVIAFASLLFAIVFGVFLSGAISVPIQSLVRAADKLALGDVDVELEKKQNDEVGALTDSFIKMAHNIKEQAEGGKRIAAGDFDFPLIPRSEKDVLANSMVSVIETLKGLVAEAELLTNAAVAGDLETRGDSSKFDGGYKQIIEGFNKTLDAVVLPLSRVVWIY